jgi:hypothetical protein
LINVNKICDIMQLYHKGQNMSFVSKNGFTNREIPFLRRFEGGMLYTCGLEDLGGRPGFELHGTLHNNPAQILRAECNEDGIVVEALIHDTALVGKNLAIKRRITSAIGGDSVTVHDTLINEGYRDEDYCILYHVNMGYPMLDDGARIVGDIAKSDPRSEWANQHRATSQQIGMPVANREETCYFLTLNKPEISLVNDKIGKTLTITYSAETLPHMVEWKNTASGEYVLGLEPCTTELDDRFTYRTIKAQESVEFEVSIAVRDHK